MFCAGGSVKDCDFWGAAEAKVYAGGIVGGAGEEALVIEGSFVTGEAKGAYAGAIIGCATEETVVSDNCRYLEGSAAGNAELGDMSASAEEFASGVVCYVLNSMTSGEENAWRQNLGSDSLPVLDAEHGIVYADFAETCLPQTYSNDPDTQDERVIHWFEDGVCIYCGISETGEGFSYSDNGDGTAAITGYSGSETDVVIPTEIDGIKITAIAESAFKNNTAITSVVVPNGVTEMGESAFYGCTALTNAYSPKDLTEIPDNAFYKCTSLCEIDIPDGAAAIGASAFYGCTALQGIVIPGNVVTIGSEAFRGCTALGSAEIADGVEELGYYAFYGCTALGEVVIPESVTEIGYGAFAYCSSVTAITLNNSVIGSYMFKGNTSLEEVVIPENITEIRSHAFENCTKLKTVQNLSGVMGASYMFSGCTALTEVHISEGATAIGDYTFYNCSALSEINIPESVESIGTYAFYQCKSLVGVDLPSGLATIGNYAFYDCDALESVVIPEGVTTIGSYAFRGCDALASVAISGSVTAIGGNAFRECGALSEVELADGVESIGEYAFYNCASLLSITLPESVTSIGNYAFYKCTAMTSAELSEGLVSIGEYAFYGCSALTSAEIPDSVTSIGASAFYSCALTSVRIPSSVEEIGNYAFYSNASLKEITLENAVIGVNMFRNCTALTSVVIPANVKTVGACAFNGCTKLASATIEEGVDDIDWGLFANCTALKEFTLNNATIGRYMFSGCTALTSVVIPEDITSIGSYAFESCTKLTKVDNQSAVMAEDNMFVKCTALTEVNIPEGITEIGESTFERCTALAEITLPESVTSIGKKAFYACSALTEITLPDGLEHIYSEAFNASGLKSIELPEGMTIIDYRAFYGASSLESVVVPDSVTSIGGGAFYDCSALTDMAIPEGVTSIGNSAFYNCSSLAEIVIPEGITAISSSTFSGCKALTGITIPEGVTSIGDSAFSGCTSLTEIVIPEAITEIPLNAFNGCTALASAELPDGLLCIGEGAFNGCTALTGITLPDGLTTIGEAAFGGAGLTSVVVPESVTSISTRVFRECKSLVEAELHEKQVTNYMFLNCSALEKVTMYDTVTSISTIAFVNCSPLPIICCYPGSYAETFAINYGYEYEYIFSEDSFTLLVSTPDGASLTEGYSVNWYEKDSGNLIASGNKLSGVDSDIIYEYEIILDDELIFTYYQPERAAASEAYIEVILEAMPVIAISGSINADNGEIPSDANIKVIQTKNGNTKTFEVYADEKGKFSFEAVNVPTAIYISADKYYSVSKVIISEALTESELILDSIILSPLPQNRITLSIYEIASALPGESGEESEITSFDDINFSIRNVTENFNVTDFTVQYPYIIINDADVKAGDEIEITASSQSTNSVAASVILSNAVSGTAAIKLKENGKFYVKDVNTSGGLYAIVFDENGNYIKRYIPSTTSFYSDIMSDGNYSVVFIEKNSILRSFSSIAKLSEFGLVEGEDYCLVDVGIESGMITEISGVDVPSLDTSKFLYTDSDNTSVSISKSDMTTGNIALLRVEYKISDTYNSNNEELIFDIPEGMDLLTGGVTLDGKSVVYTQDENGIHIKTNEKQAVVRMYVSAYEAGDYDLNVLLQADVSGDTIVQPIGTARTSANLLTLTVDDVTSDATVLVSGTTIAKSEITLYDMGTEIGQTTANSVGNWAAKVELETTYKNSPHVVYAMVSGYTNPIESEHYVVISNPTAMDVLKVTMYNTAHPESSGNNVEYTTVIDFKNAQATIPQYRYWPKYPSFTFKIEFDGEIDSSCDVDLYVYTSSGETEILSAQYDSETNAWLATAEFYSGSLPVSLEVVYDATEDYSIDRETLQKMCAEIANIADGDSYSSFDNAEILDADSRLFIYDGVVFTVDAGYKYVDEINEDNILIPIELSDGAEIYISNAESEGIVELSISAEKDVVISMPYLFGEVESIEGDGKYISLYFSASESILEYFDENSVDETQNTTDAFTTMGWIKDHFRNFLDDYNRRLKDWNNCLDNRITNLEENGLDPDVIQDLFGNKQDPIKQQNDLEDLMNNINNTFDRLDKLELNGLNDLLDLANTYGDLISMAGQLGTTYNLGEKAINVRVAEQLSGIKTKSFGLMADDDSNQTKCSPNCPCEICMCRHHKGPHKIDPIYDPSGYVYEAVPSNRVEGVTATAYTYEDVLDDFGEATGEQEIVLWNAEDYDQVNPLVTDANGEYAWDVPEGEWMVKFEKDGYETAYSEWLPVPPPQTEVNVGIVSLSPPEVKAVSIYSDSIRIEFTQYMELDSVNGDTVSVTAGGKKIAGTIEPVNAEENYDGSAEYASIFLFTPESAISGAASVEVKNAVNYAGTAMEEKYAAAANVVPAPTGIEAAESVTVGYNSSTSVEVMVLEGEAGKNVTLKATSSSPSIVSVVNETAVTDEEGKATFALSGNLPGSGEITITIDGTDISWVIKATVGDVVSAERCGKVTASVESGSVVEKGTKVELSSSTSGAVIYYTTDGSDPTESATRTLYSEAIEITADTVIIAYAEKDGLEASGTAGFAYTIEKEASLTGSVTIAISGEAQGTLIAAAFDEEGVMLFARMFDAGDVSGEALVLEDVLLSDISKMSKVKIFQWSADGTMQPTADVAEAEIQ
ncbi:MAG: leucine-rich repeat protein [Clostridia bacterium]|nr:leucine-rich repeat protein [Clostridia bacterium]